jgi:hypothetical protein
MKALVLCKCGGSAKYISSWGMDDQYVCTSCEYKTKNYFDGAEYAASEWTKRNDPNYVDPIGKSMASLRAVVMRNSRSPS